MCVRRIRRPAVHTNFARTATRAAAAGLSFAGAGNADVDGLFATPTSSAAVSAADRAISAVQVAAVTAAIIE